MSFTTPRVQVTTTAAQLVAPAGIRRSTVIYNRGPNDIAIGADNTITMANGFVVPAGATVTVDHDPHDEIWAICSVLQVAPADTCLIVETSA